MSTGVNCEFRIDSCGTINCLNGGICTNSSYPMCICQYGYTGAFCETIINFCSSMPCLNRATCNPIRGSFECNCSRGFGGILKN
jgi:hypothetical protein